MAAQLANDSFRSENDIWIGPYLCRPSFPVYVVSWIVIGAGLPLTVATIVAVYSLVRKDQVISVFLINLFISDLMQFLAMIVRNVGSNCNITGSMLAFLCFTMMVSVSFMVCVSMERYLTVAWPLWYRCHRSNRSFMCVCVLVWLFPAAIFLPVIVTAPLDIVLIIFGSILLLPFPLFIFFLCGSIRALSASRSVPANEKRRFVAILVAVLLIYTLLFLPWAVCCLVEETDDSIIFSILAFAALQISPLADLTLYVLIRKDLINKQLASLCCCLRETDSEVQESSQDGPPHCASRC